jgi:hypothetical protein
MAALASSCAGRRDDNSSMSIRGVRLSATVALRGADFDTLRVLVTGTNTTRTHKMIPAGGGCSEAGDEVHVVLTMHGRRWDSAVWRELRQKARLAGREQVCLAYAIAVQLPAGATKGIASADLPIAAILGDSLPPGRYRVRAAVLGSTARVVPGSGAVAGARADEVELGGREVR